MRQDLFLEDLIFHVFFEIYELILHRCLLLSKLFLLYIFSNYASILTFLRVFFNFTDPLSIFWGNEIIVFKVVEGEGVTAVHFADSFPGKNNFDLSKCLYIGTSLGSVLVIVIVVPEAEAR